MQPVMGEFALAKPRERDPYKFIEGNVSCSNKERGKIKTEKKSPMSRIYYHYFFHIIAKSW